MTLLPFPTALVLAPQSPVSLKRRKAYVRRLIREAAHRSKTRSAHLVRRRGGREVLEIWWRESSYNPRARHRRTGAMGLAGMRPMAWRSIGLRPSWNPHRQAQAFFLYVDAHPIYRGDPAKALAFLRRRGYY